MAAACSSLRAHRAAVEAHERALFDRLFWSWRSEDLRIVEIEQVPFALDSAWSPPTVQLFADLWTPLAPALDGLRAGFERALGDGELVGRFEYFKKYADAWGDMLERGADEGLGLIVDQFEG